ncbi:Bromodomain adjacent to zinc finger domain protein 2 [Caenorhabditis elegans]|uniref:Bromodomain adjacent to zinc finger domain protein 2 n=1 Tax=Caenorhabditis elegans TaxID=6239 RepID=BAZ2_CAEEL|nr:Bromodomain adjacent to zinc finger domain protein 2 [Caenorhabditis elegans]Q23590.4 RecName: Full=Bromodomain adjacent to zinc finger domain protein 2 [Caenorhabditis elegans]CCD65251.2 Bromodomain adjacent to zinc finger domain protein 2 [Caenorhabditis elegans]|eukprot:NP_498673.3 Bromodomain Adjacent to Zinc finger domain, 2A/2B, homolog [Caenorhabditis elegans]
MSDNSSNQFLLLLAAAQQQQQQQLLQQQLAKIQKATASSPSKSTNGTSASTSAVPSTSGTSSSQNEAAQLQNLAKMQQIQQLAQFGALMAAQKKQQEKAAADKAKEKEKEKQKAAAAAAAAAAKASASTSSASAIPGLSPEMLAAWQQAIQMQALQQMMMTPQKSQMEEAIKKMMDMAKKKPAGVASTSSASTSSSTPSTSSASITSSNNNAANNAASNMMNNVMWQLVAAQMQQKQQQQQKDTQKKADQAKKAKELAKQQQKEQDVKNKQQEEILKFLMAQHQLNHQKKHEKKQADAAALAAKVLAAHRAALESDSPEEGKKTNEAMLRLPLQLGWRRQTCVRSIASAGVKGDVSYFAPCGKKLSTYSEVVRYLTKNSIHYITRDNFLFNTKLVIGEFIVPKQTEADETQQEREFAMFTEDDINKELTRLNVLKFVPKIQASTSNGVHEDDIKMSKIEEPDEPLDPSELNDEFTEELVHSQIMSNGVDECKIREREADDLLVNINDVRHLPDFSRIGNQCLSSQGFADALMVHEFVQNFGHVLGIDLEIAPKLESLCAGLDGDANHAEQTLQLTRQLLRLALEFPGMGNEKRFGQGGGEMGLDRENFSEVMRLFLIDKGKRGEELSQPLLTCNFLSISPEQKASILAFLCDELVCSRNVVTEIDKNLDEISRLKGEKWMREGKARALRSARSKKKNDEKVVVVKEEQNHESDSEPPTRPDTPKKATVAPPTVVSVSPVSAAQQQQRKFTPGLGQCEVLTEQEESMSLQQMDSLIGDLHQEAQNINQKIHDTGLKIRSFPFGTDRFHRNYWMLAHTDKVIIESLATTSVNNPACNANEYASKDPPTLEQRVPGACETIDLDVIACVEDLVDDVVLLRAKADKKTRKRYRRIENHMKRGWWTMQNRDCVESLRSCMLSRGIRERALHRLLTKPWFLNELKFGTITIEPVGEKSDLELVRRQGWTRLNTAIDKLQCHLKMSDVSKPLPSITPFETQKPIVVPPTMALAQIVKDDMAWKVIDEEVDGQELDETIIRQKIIETADMVQPKFWRPKFQKLEDQDTCQLFEDWKSYVSTEAQTTSQLMVALQTLEGMIMWERSSREALCQICKSMDGDEMLVCDGCESGCHMECFRPRMTKVPEGDWFCQRCREEKSGRPMCMFCSRETGNLHQCQRCAYHVHQECSQDGPKEAINPETFICGHCQEMKQMRFVKRLILRSESEERELEDDNHAENGENTKNGHMNGMNGAIAIGVHNQQNGVKGNLKRKLEVPSIGGLPKNMNKELCQLMLDELVVQANALPFLEPVNPKLVPGYKMIISKPMDLKTIRQKNEKLIYETPEDFAEDIELMFANCRQFNIDHSEIGRAGISLHKFFQKRWKQLKYNFTKRLRRLHR